MTAVGDLRDRTRQSRVTGSELPFADALHRLDQRLAAAVDGIPAPNDPLVGGDCGPAFDWITRTYELTAFELDMLLVALSPEVDSRYGRAFALLQDDLTRTRPTVELTLNLLCANGCDIGRIRHVATDAPLRANRLLRVVPDPRDIEPALGSHYLVLDSQIADVLLGSSGLDRRLAGWCRIFPATEHGEPRWNAVRVERIRNGLSRAAPVYVYGPPGSGRRAAVRAAASAIGRPVLYGDLRRMPRPEVNEDALHCFLREAALFRAVAHLDGVDEIDETVWRRAVLRSVAGAGPVVLAGRQPWTAEPGFGVTPVSFGHLDADDRRACWLAHLESRAVAADDVNLLAQRFALTPGEIEAAAMASTGDTLPELTRAARLQTGHKLAALADRVVTVATWRDLVLPDDALASLRELCATVAGRERVLGDWGFGRTLSRGTGVTALFSGPSGTGKTMAAEVVANDLRLDLFRIDLSCVVSKYIGETEKNLRTIFAAAESANAVLLFDEADALMGKRSEVRDAHDRYANLEVAYLLQAMETYRGVAILATNLRHHLDDAFVRRLAFAVHFPFPDETSRLRIWQGIWPAATPLADDVDLAVLAQRYKLGGGNIRNIALAAAYLAQPQPIAMRHLLHAIRREYQKLGKVLDDADFDAGGDPT